MVIPVLNNVVNLAPARGAVEATVYALSRQLDDGTLPLRAHQLYYDGGQPLAFLSPADAESLKGRLLRLPVNYCRHAVDLLADRLIVEGFATGSGTPRDLDLWRAWRRAGMVEGSDQAHRSALVFGRCPVSVWSDPAGGSRVRVEDPRQTIVGYDPASGMRTAALKRWQAGGFGWAVLYGPDVVRRLQTAGEVPAGAELPAEGWIVVETLNNPLGRVPVVDVVNRPRVGNPAGTSELADIEPAVDALTKVMTDAMVSAEYGARPRRFTLGVEISEDAAGNPVNPFVDGPGRVWQLEGDRTTATVGQLDPMGLGPYVDLAALLTHQIAALASLPPHLAGIRQDQPSSAEALRASEAGLAGRARTRQRAFGGPWCEVVRLAAEATDGKPRPDLDDLEVLWTDPETSSPAQAADAASKLVQSGILSVDGALDALGYSPEQREAERVARRTAALDGQGLDLTALLSGPAA